MERWGGGQRGRTWQRGLTVGNTEGEGCREGKRELGKVWRRHEEEREEYRQRVTSGREVKEYGPRGRSGGGVGG